jgi:hypothetical protein
MDESVKRWAHPELKELVLEASQALALLDAQRLQELALSCQLLNRDLETAGTEDRARLARQARDSNREMEVLASVLNVTRSNLNVMNRLRDARVGSLEYSDRPSRRFGSPGNEHGDN